MPDSEMLLGRPESEFDPQGVSRGVSLSFLLERSGEIYMTQA